MEDQTQSNLKSLAKAIETLHLTPEQIQDKERQAHIQKVNFASTEAKLNEHSIPKSLRIHIPRQPGNWLRLNEETRKIKSKQHRECP
mmetsp:Transcript_26166/g.42109  ORF Transcript_26166/g.42109 Transcript_26166/m.42109 type:complete len:87 (-) Transcript_26166:77-337(-)